jgi:hypothetical protein
MFFSVCLCGVARLSHKLTSHNFQKRCVFHLCSAQKEREGRSFIMMSLSVYIYPLPAVELLSYPHTKEWIDSQSDSTITERNGTLLLNVATGGKKRKYFMPNI